MNRMILILSAASLFACGGSTLSLSTHTGPPAAATASSASRALTLSNGIVLTRVRVVVSEVTLEPADTTATVSVPGSVDAKVEGEDEIEAGPFLLDLAGATLDGGAVQKLSDASFKAGTYHEIKFKIHKPEGAENGVAGNAAVKEMADRKASVIVDGTIGTATFTFISALEAQQKSEGTFDLKSGSNVTLNVDETTWFGSGTALLDPRNEANRSQIESNIRASFRAFKDDGRKGHSD